MSRWADMSPKQQAEHMARVLRWQQKNPEKAKRYKRTWHEENPARVLKNKTEWQRQNPEKARVNVRRYYRNNAAIMVARAAFRRAQLRKAEVLLLPIERTIIRAFYDTARRYQEVTGEPFHVDHIHPLSKGGKHHPSNLQVLRGIDNLKKGARHA